MNPFPLQTDLRKIRPNVGRLVTLAAFAAIYLAQGAIQGDPRDLLQPVVLGALAVIGIGLIWLIRELWFKQIFANAAGVGVAWRGADRGTWYSFDELRQAKLSGAKGSGLNITGRVQLDFFTGTVTLFAPLYHKEDIEMLVRYVEARRRPTPEPVSLDKQPMSPPKQDEQQKKKDGSGSGTGRRQGWGRKKDDPFGGY